MALRLPVKHPLDLFALRSQTLGASFHLRRQGLVLAVRLGKFLLGLTNPQLGRLHHFLHGIVLGLCCLNPLFGGLQQLLHGVVVVLGGGNFCLRGLQRLLRRSVSAFGCLNSFFGSLQQLLHGGVVGL